MNELNKRDAIDILLYEKKKADLNLEKAYNSYCLFPNERDQDDYDRFSALSAALEMAIDAIETEEMEGE